MDAARYQRACDLVDEALALDFSARAQFLDQACADDQALRAEVDELLAEEDRLGDTFLKSPASHVLRELSDAGLPETPRIAERLPDQIGPYRVLRLLGEGGMGTVILAEQSTPYRRKVALKLIQGLRTADRRRRFVAECEALARLNHPNVCALYEAGTLDDPQMGVAPYVSMEWIDGLPITRWCDRKRLSLEARLRLFIGACAGVQHAHEKGILHCDLKPSNVMVTEIDAEPVAKIIDFGIARAAEESSDFESGWTGVAIAGSLAYLSPESVVEGKERNVDTRSDVYSLGLILYELLCGYLPHDADGEDIFAALQRLKSHDPVPPSARWSKADGEAAEKAAVRRGLSTRGLKHRLAGDLDAIVMKAIARNRSERYLSPVDLVRDLRRYLSHKPIRARAPSLGYVATRFMRRRWKTTAITVSLLLLLIAGIVARGIEARRANEAAALARAEAERANTALRESQALAGFVLNLFSLLDPERGVGQEVTALELLDYGASQVDEDLAEQPYARSRVLQELSEIQSSLGRFEESEVLARRALELRRAHYPAEAFEIAESLDQLGTVLRRQRRYEESEAALSEALAILKNRPDPLPVALAGVYNSLGNLWYSRGDYAEAEKSHREATALRREHTDNPVALAESLNNLGVMLRFQDKFKEAREALHQAQLIFSEELGPLHAQATAARFNLAYIDQKLGRWDLAEATYLRTVDEWQEVYGAAHPRTMLGRRGLSLHYLARKRWDQMLALNDASRALLEQGTVDFAARQTVLRHYALALGYTGRLEEARAIFEPLVEESIRENGADTSGTLTDQGNLAWLDYQAGDLEEAERNMRAVLARRVELSGEDHSHSLWLKQQIARVLRDQGRLAEAREIDETLLKRLDGLNSDDELKRAGLLHDLGTIAALAAEEERAEALYRQALELRQAHLESDHPDVLESRSALRELAAGRVQADP